MQGVGGGGGGGGSRGIYIYIYGWVGGGYDTDSLVKELCSLDVIMIVKIIYMRRRPCKKNKLRYVYSLRDRGILP